jgi:outer membrane protein OmpA-like peptidoglycan-associated protein
MKSVYTLSLAALAVLSLSCAGPRTALLDLPGKYVSTPVDFVNTPADELSPVATPEGLYFVSDRDVGGKRLHRIYFLPADARSASDIVKVNIEGGELRSGALVFTDDKVYFGQCYRRGGVGDCDLYSGTMSRDGRTIDGVRLLPKPLNDIEWDHHPAISPDGRLLVFASERLGGIGGSDVWMSTWTGDAWGAPVLMTSNINTSGNEVAPVFSKDGRRLYFASDGRSGFGGFDLYVSEYRNGEWQAPKLLPEPFNSRKDDLFLHGGTEQDVSYVASNRSGGKGGFDLYRIEKPATPPPPPPPPERRPLALRVVAENAYTRERIQAAITISDAGSDRQLAEGSGTVEIPVPEATIWSVTASHPGFMSAFTDVSLEVREGEVVGAFREGTKDVVERVISLIPVSEEERKIYAFTVEFDFDLFDIRPEEERKLDSAAVLLSLYPNSTVVISGHTDSVGTEAYNIKLGYNRATEVSRYVATWLRQREVILQNPLEIRTYGKTQPIASNTTAEGRQRNRRVEIAIIRNE